MKKSKYAPIYRALGAWVLSLMMLLTPLLAWAACVQPLEITLEWTGTDGTPKVASATPVPYPGYENALWLYLDAEAIGQDASLRLNDTMGQFAGGFALPDGRRLEGDMPLSSLPYCGCRHRPWRFVHGNLGLCDCRTAAHRVPAVSVADGGTARAAGGGANGGADYGTGCTGERVLCGCQPGSRSRRTH